MVIDSNAARTLPEGYLRAAQLLDVPTPAHTAASTPSPPSPTGWTGRTHEPRKSNDSIWSSERVVTYAEQILSDALPRSIVIVDARAIGVDFAYILRNYGVEVAGLEFLDRVLPLEDEEVSAELRRQYGRPGIQVHTGTRHLNQARTPPAGVVMSAVGDTQWSRDTAAGRPLIGA